MIATVAELQRALETLDPDLLVTVPTGSGYGFEHLEALTTELRPVVVPGRFVSAHMPVSVPKEPVRALVLRPCNG